MAVNPQYLAESSRCVDCLSEHQKQNAIVFLLDGLLLNAASGGGIHDFLSPSHPDTNPTAVVRGSLIVGSSDPLWSQFPIGEGDTVLRSNGTDPIWAKLALNTDVVGTLAIVNGGTNSSTSLNNNRIMVSSGGKIVEAAALTNGQLLIGSTGAAPVAASLLAGSNITITPGAGSITIASTVGTHSVLDALVHTDSVTQAVVRGSLIYGNSTPKWDRLAIGAAGTVLTSDGTDVSWASPTNTGTVTSFSSSDLSPLFTTSVATATTTPALSFALSAQAANLIFAGPASGAAAGPTFRSLVALDLPATAVVPATYGSSTQVGQFTVDQQGRITSATDVAIAFPVIDLTVDVTGVLPVANGGTGTGTAFTQGSVIFAGAGGVLSQDNANFFWDDTNNRLGIGIAFPTQKIHVSGAIASNPSVIVLGNDTASFVNVQVGTNIADGGLVGARVVLHDAGTSGKRWDVSSGGFVAGALTIKQITDDILFATFNGRGVLFSGGTVTVDNPIINLAQTWNAAGVTFNGIKLNITNTASAAASLLMDLQVSAVSKFRVSKAGHVDFVTSTSSGQAALTISPFGAAAGNTSEIRFLELAEGGTNYTGFKAPDAITASEIYVLPNAAPAANRFLQAAAVAGGVSVLSWSQVSLTADITGVLPATNGGTGQSTYAVGDILYANTTTTLAKLADVATGNALISGGVSTAPSWGKIALTTHVSGILPVANGGSGTSTVFTAGSVIFAGASGVYAQDNANFFWDDSNNRLGLGIAVPLSGLHVVSLVAGTVGLIVKAAVSQTANLTEWQDSSAVANTVINAAGNISIPATTSTAGIVFQGTNSLLHTFGTNNFFIGDRSGNFTMTGINNVGVGTLSLRSLTSGGYNVANGLQALFSATTGSFNVAMGYQALIFNTTGVRNFALGYGAMFTNVSGSDNVGIGTQALYLCTGSNNIVLGSLSGDAITTGSNNIVIGFNIDSPTATSSNTLTLGNLIFGTGLDGAGVALSSGGIGIRVITPTAKLHLCAGTATASTAPLKFNTGTSLTVAEAGAMEFTTDDLFFTITTGAARKRLLMADATAGLTSGKMPIATTNGRLIDLTASAAYTPTNVVADRSFDAATVLTPELANVVGAMIADLQAKGILG